MQSRINTKKLILTVTAFLVVATFSIIYQLSLIFSESVYFNKQSWPYLTLLAADIKQVPIYSPLESSVSYRYGIGDGVTETTHSVMYKTTLEDESLFARYKHYFESNGQVWVHEPLWPSAIFYEGKGARYQLRIEATGIDKKLVTIDFYNKTPVEQTHPLKDRPNYQETQ